MQPTNVVTFVFLVFNGWAKNYEPTAFEFGELGKQKRPLLVRRNC